MAPALLQKHRDSLSERLWPPVWHVETLVVMGEVVLFVGRANRTSKSERLICSYVCTWRHQSGLQWTLKTFTPLVSSVDSNPNPAMFSELSGGKSHKNLPDKRQISTWKYIYVCVCVYACFMARRKEQRRQRWTTSLWTAVLTVENILSPECSKF